MSIGLARSDGPICASGMRRSYTGGGSLAGWLAGGQAGWHIPSHIEYTRAAMGNPNFQLQNGPYPGFPESDYKTLTGKYRVGVKGAIVHGLF